MPDDSRKFAEFYLASCELAHEIEDILEQLDGIDLRAQDGNGVVWKSNDTTFETRRAIEAGLLVELEIARDADRGEPQVTTRRIFWRRVPQERMQAAVRDGDWKMLNDEGRVFLFNVRTDPGERDDLAARHPDIVRKLAQLHEDWRKDVGIPPPSPQK